MAKNPVVIPEDWFYPVKQVRISVRVSESERDDLQNLARREDGGVSGLVHELITKELYAPRFYWRAHVICAVPLALIVGICVGINLELDLETQDDIYTSTNFSTYAVLGSIFYGVVWLGILHSIRTRLKPTTRYWRWHPPD
jgi:hypothetical protein